MTIAFKIENPELMRQMKAIREQIIKTEVTPKLQKAMREFALYGRSEIYASPNHTPQNP